MTTYHSQLKPLTIPRSRRQALDDPLTPAEVKKLRGILGSLQWLVAQVRFDLAFTVSSLQSEKHTMGTLLRANKALIDAKKHGDFHLRFQRIPLAEAGVVMVCDAALGNVDAQGRVAPDPNERVHSQSCYAIILADSQLSQGKRGKFNVLDFRSHRLARVARSSYAAETIAAEEGMDAAELVRGFIAEALGIPLQPNGFTRITKVALTGVTDARDCFDRVTSDTGFGTQKSLMLTVASLRQQFRRPQTTFRWTATSNMWVDAGTKQMENEQLRQTLLRGEWSIEYQEDFVKQTFKKKKTIDDLKEGTKLPGREAQSGDFQLMQHVHHFALSPGWHFSQGVGVQVARLAKSFRGPSPRFALRDFPLRTTVGEFVVQGRPIWQILEERVDMRDMASLQEILPVPAATLVSFYETAVKATEKYTHEET